MAKVEARNKQYKIKKHALINPHKQSKHYFFFCMTRCSCRFPNMVRPTLDRMCMQLLMSDPPARKQGLYVTCAEFV